MQRPLMRTGRLVDMPGQSVDIYLVVIACPNTGKATATGHELGDLAAFKFVGLVPEAVKCAHCPEWHVWQNDQAWPERRDGLRFHVPAAQPAPPRP